MLKLTNISKSFDRFELRSVNLEVAENEFFVVLGPSGAGKTLLLELIAGLRDPTEGEVYLDGESVASLPPERRKVGLVYQDYALFPNMNVWDNISFGLKIRKDPKERVAKKVLEIGELLQIEDIMERSPVHLSGGEKQRVALARALVLEPSIVLLDEPLSSLDPPLRERLQKELKRIHSLTRTTFVQVTHDFEEAVFLADRIAIMREGEIVQVGSAEEVMCRPADDFVADFVGVKNIFQGALVEDGDGLKWFECGDLRIQVQTLMRDSCQVSIPAEDILLSNEKLASSARNSIRGSVVDILPRGRLKEVVVDVGQRMVALVTQQSLAEMGLAKGVEVWVTFKTSAVHAF
jgi:molybdopterin-binding protein